MSDSLAPEIVEPLLRGRFGRPCRYAEETETTQALLGPDDPEGAVAVAELQTAGRGRLGRRWEVPAGTAIQLSILLRPPADAAIQQLSLVGGLAVAETVEQALDLSAQIKWPNDGMVNRRNAAGGASTADATRNGSQPATCCPSAPDAAAPAAAPSASAVVTQVRASTARPAARTSRASKSATVAGPYPRPARTSSGASAPA